MVFHVPSPFWLHILCQNTVHTFILLSWQCMIILLAAFYYLLSTTLIRTDLRPISLEPMFYAMPSLQHKIMTVLFVVENVRFVDGLISGFRCRATRRNPDASVSEMSRYLIVFKVDPSLITRVRMIWCSYKNSQVTFRSEQREMTPKQKSRESMEIPELNRTEKENKAHPQHTHYAHNSTLLWWVHVQPGLKSNHSGNSRWGYSPYKRAFFIMFSQQSTTSSVLLSSWVVLNWAITVHWSGEMFPMDRHEYVTTQHKGMNRTGVWRKSDGRCRFRGESRQ